MPFFPCLSRKEPDFQTLGMQVLHRLVLLIGVRIACQQCVLEEMSSDEDAAHKYLECVFGGFGTNPSRACLWNVSLKTRSWQGQR